MKKFVPRQRKHKVLARSKVKESGDSSTPVDSNILEYLPPTKSEIEKKKQLLREELLKQGPKVSGKKAKRLEKYINTKLKKDENRDLIEKLANGKVDTSLLYSSRKLGQRKESKREQLSRALRDRQAGIDINGDNEEILFERKPLEAEVKLGTVETIRDVRAESFALPEELAQSTTIKAAPPLGIGLKRPLEFDEGGKPLLKKRKRRGGVKSAFSFRPEPSEELEWEGFSSPSEHEGECSSEDEPICPESIDSERHISEDSAPNAHGSISGPANSSDTEGSGADSPNDTESDGDGGTAQERSSAFKHWAMRQRNEASGYKPGIITNSANETPKILNFQPRALEEDPLPLELRLSKNIQRKSFFVSVERQPEIQVVRLQLPVVAEEQKIMEAIHNHPVVVIYGATGSGKTTQVPQFLYEAGYGSSESPTPGMIGVTQPRRVAAVSMAKRVADELGNHGSRVAYQIRFEANLSPQTVVKFMTDGVLLREISQDIALRKYSAIIIDEAHERSVNTDILIGMMSRVVRLREEMALEDPSMKPLKLIIMSATLRITDFTENPILFKVPPPVLQAEGRQYPVTTHFSRKTPHDYLDEAFRKISKGHRKLPPGGFLVFLTGQNEIMHLSRRLKEAFRIGTRASGPVVIISGQDLPMEAEDIEFGDVMDDTNYSDNESVDIEVDDADFEVGITGSGPSKMHILPLYSLLSTREQLRVFEPPPDGSRLVILATNVAETSLTIPGISYVFDCGRSKERKFDRQTGVQSFEVDWISKASANQRAGRAGRTGPGHCYRLYSSAVYERAFREFTEPEILRMPIEGVVLQLKAMNLQHVVNFPFPTPPDRQILASSERLLTYLSAVSLAGQITPIGITMSIFPLSPRFARILLIGHLHDCLPYTIAMVAGLSAANVFVPENQVAPIVTPKDGDTYSTNEDRIEEEARNNIQRRFNKVQKNFCFLDDKSDAIKLLQVVGEFAHEPTESWCHHHFVRYKVLREILQLRRQITDLLRFNIPAFANLKFQEKLDPPTAKQVKALKQMVTAGFIDHVAIRADMSPDPPSVGRKPARAIDVPYLTLFPSHNRRDTEDKAVYIHPSSPLAHVSPQECPEYVVYSHLQRATSSAATDKIPKTRMHALTDISSGQLATLAKGTPLLQYGKPIKEVMSKAKGDQDQETVRECWVVPYLRAEGTGGLGWPLPARKVTQRKISGRGWVVE